MKIFGGKDLRWASFSVSECLPKEIIVCLIPSIPPVVVDSDQVI